MGAIFATFRCTRNATNKISSSTDVGQQSQDTDRKIMNIARTRRTKRTRIIVRMSVMIAIPGLAMTAFAARQLNDSMNVYNTMLRAKKAVNINFALSDLITALQIERGLSTTYLSSGRANTGARQNLVNFRNQTNIALVELPDWPDNFIIGRKDFDSKTTLEYHIERHRLNLEEYSVTVETNIVFYTSITEALIQWGEDEVLQDFPGVKVTRKMLAANALLKVSDYIDLHRALGSAFYTQCQLTPEDSRSFFFIDGRITGMQQILAQFDAVMYNDIVATLQMINSTLRDMARHKSKVRSESFIAECLSMPIAQRFSNSYNWFLNMTIYIDSLVDVRNRFDYRVSKLLKVMISEVEHSMYIFASIMVAVLLAGMIVALWFSSCIYRMSGDIVETGNVLSQQHLCLREQSDRSQYLIYCFLPKKIAMQIRAKVKVAPEYFESVTIFFSDVVGFGDITNTCTPLEIVKLLNDIYSLYNRCMEKYDVFKVETIVDGHFIASGLPERNGDLHVCDMSMLALDIRRCIHECSIPNRPHKTIDMRFGIHTGPVTGAVIGNNLKKYCLLGDTITVAHKMESTGASNKIHISEPSKDLLERQFEGFVFEPRSDDANRDKLQMVTYWLVRRNTDVSISSPID